MYKLSFFAISLMFFNSVQGQIPITEVAGFLKVYHPKDTTSIYIGKNVTRRMDTSFNHSNTYLGISAGANDSLGYHNCSFGNSAGLSNIDGEYNSFFGASAGKNSLSASNSFFGADAGRSTKTGGGNSFFGFGAGYNNEVGGANSFFGTFAGLNIKGGSNIAIGNYSGPEKSEGHYSNRLYIDVERSNNPLIYGEFDNDLIRINGTLQMGSQDQVGNGTVDDGVIQSPNSAGSDLFLVGNDAVIVEIGKTESQNGTFEVWNQNKDDVLLTLNESGRLRASGDIQTRVDDGDITHIGLYEGIGSSLFGYEFQYDGSSGEDKLHLWSKGFSGNEAIRMTWKKDGNVGIGITDPQHPLHVNGNIQATTINGSSDVNMKEDFVALDREAILDKVNTLPLTEWQYKGSDERHIGPMAQDFYAAFGLGQGETTIATVDADGVALAAIQALSHRIANKEEDSEIRIQNLERQNDKLQNQVAQLHAELEKIKSLLVERLNE